MKFIEPLMIGFGFTTVILFIESFRFKINYNRYFKELHTELGISRTLAGIIGISASILFVYLFIAVSLLASVTWRVIYFLFFSLATTIEYSAMKGYGRFTVTSDWLSAYFSNRQIWVDSLRTYFDRGSIAIILCYGFLLLITKTTSSYDNLLILFSCVTAAIINLTFARFINEGTFPTLSLSAFIRTLFLLPRLRKSLTPRATLAFHCNIPATQNIVMIIDESIRADHLSLNNYERPTTKHLEQLQQDGILYNFANSSSGANSSLPSNAIILTGAKSGDKIGRDSLPSIFQYAKVMGYKTYCFDGWGPNFWLGKASDLKFIDHWQNISNFTGIPLYDVDFEMAKRIRHILNQSTGNFIWINKRGAHFDYNRNYPNQEALWKPVWQVNDRHDEMDAESRERLVNSYDNAILYNLDKFFRILIDKMNLEHTILIYTSDHGQTLGEEGLVSTHARKSRGVMNIPLFIVTTMKLFPKTGLAPTHENIFPTLLNIMKVPLENWASNYSSPLVEK